MELGEGEVYIFHANCSKKVLTRLFVHPLSTEEPGGTLGIMVADRDISGKSTKYRSWMTS